MVRNAPKVSARPSVQNGLALRELTEQPALRRLDRSPMQYHSRLLYAVASCSLSR